MTTTTWTTRTLYALRAKGGDGTPHDVLFGLEPIVYADEAEAERAAADCNEDPVWGPGGDQLPADVGLEYYVGHVRADSLEGDELDDAIRRGLIPLRAELRDDELVVVDPEGGVWWPDDDTAAEIEDSTDPEVTAVELAYLSPMDGEWRA